MARTQVTVDPEHYIPVPRHRIKDALLATAGERRDRLNALARLLRGVLRFEYQTLTEQLKRDYFPFDPAGEGEQLEEMTEAAIAAAEQSFLDNFLQLMRRGNFLLLTQQDIEVADAEDYLFSLPVQVDWSQYDPELLATYVRECGEKGNVLPEFASRALLFRRGVGVDTTEELLFLQKLDLLASRILLCVMALPGRLLGFARRGELAEGCKEITELTDDPQHDRKSMFQRRSIDRVTLHPRDVGLRTLFQVSRLQEPTFRQLVLLYRLESDDETADRSIQIRTFRDIPMADLEVVFPEKRLSMKPVDLIKVVATAVSGTAVIVAKLVISVFSPWLLFLVLGSLGVYAGRTIAGFKASRDRYRHLVTNALFAKSLDNGLGVILFLVDCMEEQEWKEMTLAWFLLESEGPCRSDELDRRCEEWIADRFDVETDFDVSDALQRLGQLQLVKAEGQTWQAHSLDQALQELDACWDRRLESVFQREPEQSGDEGDRS